MMAVIDFLLEVLALWNVVDRDIKICGHTFATHEQFVVNSSKKFMWIPCRKIGLLPKKFVNADVIKGHEEEWLLWFLAFEMGDVVAPCVVVAAWVTIFYAPNRAAFAGIGNDENGWARPDSMDGTEDGRVLTLVKNVGFFVGIELVAVGSLGLLMKLRYHLHLKDAQKWLLRKIGWEMLVLSVFAMYHIFCCMHLTCGVDISFKFKAIIDPWGWYTANRLPGTYDGRGWGDSPPGA